MDANNRHDDIVVFRLEGSAEHVFHLLAGGPRHDLTVCGRAVEEGGARLPRMVADVAGYQRCDSCRRFEHVYGEASALLQEPAEAR